MKPLNVNIIEDTPHPRHECRGHCTGTNGRDGYCYHDDGSRHPVGICRQHRKQAAQSAGRASPAT